MYDIIQKQNKIYILENQKLVEKYDALNDINSLEGNIYIGKVENVLNGIKIAFINIGKEKNGILPFSDLSKKYNEEEIPKILKPGEDIIVQVKRNEIDKKGVKLTTNISLVGKYLVFLPYDSFITISQKLENMEERKRLSKITREILPKETGAIIRTEAKWKTQLDLQQDMQEILKKWSSIRKSFEEDKIAPNVIYENSDLLDKIITNITPKNVGKIITDDLETKEKYAKNINVTYQEDFELISDISKELEDVKNRKLWLKSGAYITIDRTEALIAIDVNSAKYIGKKNAEDTFFNVNKEATFEIARQIRLRNLSGMILIDYINMENDSHKMQILELLKQELKKDRSKAEVFGFTKLNLLEMTRQHLNG